MNQMNLPKVKPTTKTYFGTLCAKHPEHGGFRLANNVKCVACSQARSYAANVKPVPHPNGSGELVTRGYAESVKPVPHPNGSGEMVTRGYAESVKPVPHPNGSGEMVTRGYARNVKLLATPEGRARNIAGFYRYHDKKRANTPELSNEDIELTNQTIEEIVKYGYSVDHIIPVSKGGEHAWWNLNALTKSTNSAKSNRDLFEPGEVDCWHDMRAANLPIDHYEQLVQEALREQIYG